MKTGSTFIWVSAVVVALTLWLPTARGQNTTHTTKAIPLIEIKGVPREDAIAMLARQNELNYILDPRVSEARGGRRSLVTVHWTNMTAEHALNRLLREQGLKAVTSPSTTTTRIVFSNQVVSPIPASQVGKDTGETIPLVAFESMPLTEAARKLASFAHLELSLDPNLPVPSSANNSSTVSKCSVNARWQKITARQALAGLLDNYDLMLVEDAAKSSAKSSAKVVEKVMKQTDKQPK